MDGKYNSIFKLLKNIKGEIGELKNKRRKDNRYEDEYKDEFFYIHQNEGDEFYAESLNAKEEKKEQNYLSKAFKAYNFAKNFSSNSVENEKIDNNLMKIKNRLRIMGVSLKDFKNLESKLPLVFIFTSFIITLFFLSLNITGNIIGNTQQDFSILGILFFLCGLVGAFVYARNKR